LFAAPVDFLASIVPARLWPLSIALAVAPITGGRQAHSYPAEDVRSAVGIIEAQAREADAVIVYPQDGYIYALYSRSPVRLVHSDLSMTGFTVAVDQPGIRTVILSPHWDNPHSRQYGRGLRENFAAIAALFAGSHVPKRVWFVGRSDGNAVSSLEAILGERGLTPSTAWKFAGVNLRLWVVKSRSSVELGPLPIGGLCRTSHRCPVISDA
jgi:hypothetical protein